jgi:hypothetical protein
LEIAEKNGTATLIYLGTFGVPKLKSKGIHKENTPPLLVASSFSFGTPAGDRRSVICGFFFSKRQTESGDL